MVRATYHPVKKRFVVKAVKDGMSLKAASEKYDVPLHTIYGWTGKLNRTSPRNADSQPGSVKKLSKDVKVHEIPLLPEGEEAEALETLIIKDAVELPTLKLDQVATTNAEGDANAKLNRRPTVLSDKTTAVLDHLGRRRRRTFTTQDKLRILAEADRAVGPGEIGALLRREGLYSSALTHWRRQRIAGKFGSSKPIERARMSKPSERLLALNTGDPLASEFEKLQKENAQLQRRLQRSEAIIELLQQLSDLLGSAQSRTNNRSISYNENDTR